tara:strand:+ start:1293 stop:2399 length:1107 start_codon:yes stop_codon:yes gene_type:complete
MNGFEKELKSKVLGFTSHVTIYANGGKNIDISFLDRLISEKKIIGYSPYLEQEGLLISTTSSTGVFFRAVYPNLEKRVGVSEDDILVGSYDDLYNIENGIIIGSGIAAKLNLSLGDDINLHTSLPGTNNSEHIQQNLKVIGIFDVGIYEYNNAYVYININLLSKIMGNISDNFVIDTVRVELHNPLKSFEFTNFFNESQSSMYAQDWSLTHQSLFLAISNEKRVMFIILMLIVAVAAFNIVSSLFMLIKNKEREIAILMTIGASRIDIVLIFLYQGFFLGSVGILFGVLLGILLSNNIDSILKYIEYLFNINLMPAEIYHLSKIPSLINNSDILFIIIYTSLLTFLSAIYPAIKASSIKPTEIFRGNN